MQNARPSFRAKLKKHGWVLVSLVLLFVTAGVFLAWNLDSFKRWRTAFRAGGWWTANAAQQVWTASGGFSSTQGENQWHYKEWNGSAYQDMTWSPTNNRWKGTYNYTWIAPDWQSPHEYDSARTWVAPQAGVIQITGNVRNMDAKGGDGVIATILKNSTVLWGPRTIAKNDTTGYDMNLATNVVVGDAIYFRINQNANSLFDAARWDPAIRIIVQPPFWQTQWFAATAITAIGSIGLTGITVALVLRARHRRRLERLELQRAREAERSRIARDIHDDLGASLTQIALLSELTQSDFDQPEQARNHLNQIFTTARTLARSLDEIVWAVNPANDTFENFIVYICKFAQDYLNLAGIRCRLDVPDSLSAQPPRRLSGTSSIWRRRKPSTTL
jgi:signal transduction histidine kinase